MAGRMKVTTNCVMCGKNTFVAGGWHLKRGIDFCSNECVAEYLETGYSHLVILRRIADHEARIRKIENFLNLMELRGASR